MIRPSTNTANQVLKTGLNQTQQVIRQAQKQISSVSGSENAAAGKALSSAATLSSCVAAAGTDATKLQSCQATDSK